ncbi:MAG TPA: phosphatidate cytidylyltransferase [Intrasporangium sp.]|uniref:phosphatidate cytidylyltransferase n=1 Tax=Intrasporangium sp. TaxID=1925024 RepID=UPI002D779CF8|nr:phosphatidate cytidylyltransferase [Intrasporangium sp.]HET7399293.1 phosphatidate cytidylyltransferase [Intrasporangium sp.]
MSSDEPAESSGTEERSGSEAPPVPEPEHHGEGLLEVTAPVPYEASLDDVATLPPEEVLEKKPPRAGRDLKAAIAVGLTLGGLVVGTLAVRKESFLVLLMAAVAVGVWEMRAALRPTGARAALAPAVLGSVGMLWAAYAGGPAALTAAWCLASVAVVLWRAAGPPEGAARDVLGGMFIVTYPAFLAGFCALLLAAEDGVGRVFVFILITVCSDVGGYAAGVLLGRHPMAPSISPKKSWEGFGGSVLLCVAGGAVTVRLILGQPWWIGMLLGVGVAVAATVGDLMESLLKRDLGIKDMSNLLPGHGGLMDRLDSLIVVAPIVWAVLTLLAPTAR